MLKKRDLHEVPVLFELSSHPEVYPYLRYKANSLDEFYFLTKKMIQAEEDGQLISRTILDEYEQPIGTINLYDIHEQSGFLATWVGQPYFGKGYNKLAKEMFLHELFYEQNIETVFMKVKRSNIRSLRAVHKLSYTINGKDLYPEIYEGINKPNDVYELFVICKEHYVTTMSFMKANENDAEVVL